MITNNDNQEPTRATPDKEAGQEESTPLKKDNSTANSTTGTVLGKTFAIFLIVAGLVIGFFIGIMINFGGCYKQSCNPIEQNAAIIIPLASLLFTIPVAIIAFRKKQ